MLVNFDGFFGYGVDDVGVEDCLLQVDGVVLGVGVFDGGGLFEVTSSAMCFVLVKSGSQRSQPVSPMYNLPHSKGIL